MTTSPLHTVLIYARDPRRSAAFYCRHFGMDIVQDGEGLIVLESPQGGASLALHPAARTAKLGQAGVKLVFSVQDVEAFKQQSEQRGLKFGATHRADGYTFANAKDPDRNSISISSRAFRPRAATVSGGRP
jgi:catechol 2,3-dioxygenase-like lactoylglutathione lyase family enzyme